MNIASVRANLRKRHMAEQKRLEEKYRSAEADCAKIIEMLIAEFQPHRIWQWGSLLHPDEFSDISDIDIAVEADWQPETFFAASGKAQAITRFPVDLVELDKIHPLHAETIRKRGRLIYEAR